VLSNYDVGCINVLCKAYASYLALRQRIVDAGLDVNQFDLGRDDDGDGDGL